MIVEIDKELRGWKSHCVELQYENSNLKSKVAELQAIIDAANAQEHVEKQYRYPIGLSNGVQQWTSWGSWIGGECMRDAQERKLYAHPIPEQQQQCHSGTNEYGLDIGYIAGKLNLFLRDISRHTPSEAARVLARLALVADDSIFSEPEFEQQSQAVAGPEWVMSAIKRNLCPAESCDYHCNQDQYLSGGCCKPELQKAISYLESLPSPRITEQDAREIATAWAMFMAKL